MEDRKAIRSLKHNEEGLPDILKAVFLALTEEKLDSPTRKTKSYQDSKAKAIIVEMQQKDPILFRQFQREVMKQYYYYQMTHHRNRAAMASNDKTAALEEEKKSLIESLKNAMVVISKQPQYSSIVLDDVLDEPPSPKKKETNPQVHQQQQTGAVSPRFQRKTIVTPTIIMDALFTMEEEDEQ